MWNIFCVFLCLTFSVAQPQPKHIRREIRTLTNQERDAVFETWRIMKFTPQEAGELIYGGNFKTYDYFVARHLFAVVDEDGDQAHICPTFCNWHRAFILEFERSMQAINPDVSLPYWDWGKDADGGRTYDQTIEDSGIFTNDYFGSYTPCSGRCNPEDHVVRDGAFGYWPVAEGAEALEIVQRVLNRTDVLNPFGKLLSPWNVNQIPYLIRLTNNYGHQSASFPNSTEEEKCLKSTDYTALDVCFNNFNRGSHVLIHGMVGGAAGKDDTDDWNSFIARFPEEDRNWLVHSWPLFGGAAWIGAGFGGVLQCSQDGCTCNGNVQVNLNIWKGEVDNLGTGLTEEGRATFLEIIDEWMDIAEAGPVPEYLDKLICDVGVIGGFSEAGTSPNDPIFWPIHANLDRLYLHWQERNSDLAAVDYLYPEEGFYPGCNLNDVIQLHAGGWTNLFAENDNDGLPYTHKDILRIYWETKPYIYL